MSTPKEILTTLREQHALLNRLERLIAEGRVTPAQLDLRKLGLPPELFQQISISEALADQRGER